MFVEPDGDLGPMSRFHLEENTAEVVVWLEPWGPVWIYVTYDPNEDGKVVAVVLRNPDGVTPTMLSRFAWKRYLQIAEAERRQSRFVWGTEDAKRESEHWKEAVMAAAEGRKMHRTDALKRPGRKGHPESHYEDIARRYDELFALGESAPTKRISEEHHVSRSTAAGWVATARRKELLPKAMRGRAG